MPRYSLRSSSQVSDSLDDFPPLGNPRPAGLKEAAAVTPLAGGGGGGGGAEPSGGIRSDDFSLEHSSSESSNGWKKYLGGVDGPKSPLIPNLPFMPPFMEGNGGSATSKIDPANMDHATWAQQFLGDSSGSKTTPPNITSVEPSLCHHGPAVVTLGGQVGTPTDDLAVQNEGLGCDGGVGDQVPKHHDHDPVAQPLHVELNSPTKVHEPITFAQLFKEAINIRKKADILGAIRKFRLQYNWILSRCSQCKIFGHNFHDCTVRDKTAEEMEAEIGKAATPHGEGNSGPKEGEFQVAKRRRRRPEKAQTTKGIVIGQKKPKFQYIPKKTQANNNEIGKETVGDSGAPGPQTNPGRDTIPKTTPHIETWNKFKGLGGANTDDASLKIADVNNDYAEDDNKDAAIDTEDDEMAKFLDKRDRQSRKKS